MPVLTPSAPVQDAVERLLLRAKLTPVNGRRCVRCAADNALHDLRRAVSLCGCHVPRWQLLQPGRGAERCTGGIGLVESLSSGNSGGVE